MIPCYNVQTCTGFSSLEKDIYLCSQSGFPAIEISIDKVRAFLRENTLDELGKLLKKYHVKCVSLNAIFQTSVCSGTNWERVRQELDFAVEICQSVEADYIIVLPDEMTEKSRKLSEQEIMDITADSLIKMSDYVKETGIRIAFEPVGDMLFGNIKMAWKLIRDLNRKNVGLVVDAFNLFLWDLLDDVEEIAQISADKIFMVHLNDAESIPFRKIDQMHRCMPGDGRIDVDRYMECIRKTGYDDYVSVEVLNPFIWEKGADNIIPESYEKMMRFLKKEEL